MPARDQHVLWEVSSDEARTMCVMVSCCGGAELQIVRAAHGDDEVILRELYPDHDSLYERARELRRESVESRESMESTEPPAS